MQARACVSQFTLIAGRIGRPDGIALRRETPANGAGVSRLLRMRRERPRGRAAEQRDELAPSYLPGYQAALRP